MKKILMLLLSCLLIVLLASCGSVKDIAYLQGDDLLKKTAMMDTVGFEDSKR